MKNNNEFYFEQLETEINDYINNNIQVFTLHEIHNNTLGFLNVFNDKKVIRKRVTSLINSMNNFIREDPFKANLYDFIMDNNFNTTYCCFLSDDNYNGKGIITPYYSILVYLDLIFMIDLKSENSQQVLKQFLKKYICMLETIIGRISYDNYKYKNFDSYIVILKVSIINYEHKFKYFCKTNRDYLAIIESSQFLRYAFHEILLNFKNIEKIFINFAKKQVDIKENRIFNNRYRNNLYYYTSYKIDENKLYDYFMERLEQKKAYNDDLSSVDNEKKVSVEKAFSLYIKIVGANNSLFFFDDFKNDIKMDMLNIFEEQIMTFGCYRKSEQGVFNYNNKSMKKLSQYEIMSLMAHELVPGHHLKFSHTTSPCNGIRALQNVCITEGWAEYAREVFLEMCSTQKDYTSYLKGKLSIDIINLTRAIIDIGLNTGKLDIRQAESMLIESGVDKEYVSVEISRMVNDAPGSIVAYVVGGEVINNLRGMLKNKLGDAFSLTMFHDLILEYGDNPMSIIENDIIKKFKLENEYELLDWRGYKNPYYTGLEKFI